MVYGAILTGAKNALGGLPFGVGYAAGTRIGYEQIFPAFFPSSSNTTRKYYGAPSNFKLPYYRQSRYGRSRYGRRSYGRRYSRYSRFGSRKRFFSRYRTRRFY